MNTLKDNEESSVVSYAQTDTSFEKTDTDIETPASLADRYRFIREIGHGTQGRIFLAERLDGHVKVAIKRLNIESVKNWKEYELFSREAAVLSSIHVNGVAKFYEAIERLEDEPPCSYIVQEYIEGSTLAAMLKSSYRFSLDRVYDIILQLLAILKKLHNHKPPIIHRDIKPSNIILKPIQGDEYQVFLIDFGAVANPQVQSGGSTVAGTYGFMPPEQLTGKPGPASDVYSLAAVAVNLITGRSPADMPVKDFHLIFEPDMQSMPPALVNILRSMLDPSVEARLCDIDKLMEIFSQFKQNLYDKLPGTQIAKISEAEYNRRLDDVECIGEPGNVELWQRLQDVTPRKLLTCYSKIRLVSKGKVISKEYTSDDFWQSLGTSDYEIDSNENDSKQYLYEMKTGRSSGEILFNTLVISMVVLICVIILLSQVETSVGSALFLLAFLLTVLVIALTQDRANRSEGFISVNENERNHLSTYRMERINQLVQLSAWRARGNSEQQNVKKRKIAASANLGQILRTGRKTIATITKIEYVRAERMYIKDHNVLSVSKNVKYELYSNPMFEVSYKFNPPDDEKSEDLVHSFFSHTEPDEHYQVGDPLPILYALYRDDHNVEHVDSMPFPIPLHDITDLSDIINMG